MLFTIMMLAYSTSSLPLCMGAGENATAVSTLLVTIYFVFMLVSVNCVLVRGKISLCSFLSIYKLDTSELGIWGLMLKLIMVCRREGAASPPRLCGYCSDISLMSKKTKQDPRKQKNKIKLSWMDKYMCPKLSPLDHPSSL